MEKFPYSVLVFGDKCPEYGKSPPEKRPQHKHEGAKMDRRGALIGTPRRLCLRSSYHAHHISPGASVRIKFLRKATAFWKPSFTLIRLSSCSIEITPL